MARKKIDQRVRTLIENGVQTRTRSLFVIVGDGGKDQVVNLHYILSKAQVAKRPPVLWCYKKDLGFSSNRKKRIRTMGRKKQLGLTDAAKVEEDPFEAFISSTEITYTYYHETDRILGNTFGMCILQDFEALTPNLLARTIETVQGGGIVVILLQTLSSLKQLYTMSMDVHSRYRTESRHDAVGRFNERFLLSLASCEACLILNDKLDVLPVSMTARQITPLHNETMTGIKTAEQVELEAMKRALLQQAEAAGKASDAAERVRLAKLVQVAKTLDQAKVLQAASQILSDATQQAATGRTTVSLTAARGRGKSAALGLCLASAIACGVGNIFVTSPSPENVKTLFDFVFKGLDALGYAEHMDYDIVQSKHADFNHAVVRVNVFKSGHRQTILYIQPQDAQLVGQAELMVIDEAAAIPLPVVQALCTGPQLVFMASTINGYEGTGRSLSLKLIQQLREGGAGGRTLRELTLGEPIRYGINDNIEKWLNGLLCMDAGSLTSTRSGSDATNLFPNPELCDLYAVNRDTLFSFHKASEAFLQRMMSLYVASHYKNTPNDLQLMSDAPAHRLYVLLAPISDKNTKSLPEVLAVLQVCFEGSISKQVVLQSLSRGKRAGGDLIPWTMSQQFQDDDFATLSGARVVRVAVHPDLQGMGYGTRALEQLEKFFAGKLYNGSEEDEANADGEEDGIANGGAPSQRQRSPAEDDASSSLESEIIRPRTNLKPLLVKLSDRKPIMLDWLGVSFGLTQSLFKFWRRLQYRPVYLRQTTNDITGEHTCIMLKSLANRTDRASLAPTTSWLSDFNGDFVRRFVSLLSYQFKNLPASLSLNILLGSASTASKEEGGVPPPAAEGNGSASALLASPLGQVTVYDLKRLESYANNMVDYHMVLDMVPTMSRHYFLHDVDGNEMCLSPVQAAILLAIGLQHRTIEDVERELKLPVSQLLAMFIKTARKFAKVYRNYHVARLTEQDQAAALASSTTPTSSPSGLSTPAGGKALTSSKRPIKDVGEWQALPQKLNADLKDGAQLVMKRLNDKQKELINSLDLTRYAIVGDDEEWAAEIDRKGANLSGAVLNIGAAAVAAAEGSGKTKSVSKGLFERKDRDLIKKAKKSKYARVE